MLLSLQVQAHVVQSDIDPSSGVQWLEIANGKLSTPQGAELFMRQVLLPFKVGTCAAGSCSQALSYVFVSCRQCGVM